MSHDAHGTGTDRGETTAAKRSRKPSMMIWVVTTVWGVYSCPEHAVRIYSKKARRRVFGFTLQVVDSANTAIIMWPRGDAIWLPMFAVEKIERKRIEVLA